LLYAVVKQKGKIKGFGKKCKASIPIFLRYEFVLYNTCCLYKKNERNFRKNLFFFIFALHNITTDCILDEILLSFRGNKIQILIMDMGSVIFTLILQNGFYAIKANSTAI